MMEQVSGGTLTKDEALKKALDHANLDKDQVDYIKKVELDYEHGRKVMRSPSSRAVMSTSTISMPKAAKS